MPEQNENKATQTTEFSTDAKDIGYQDKKVVLKKVPLKGQNVAVYTRPGDDVVYDLDNIDISGLEYRLVGGDIVVTMPNGGMFTFVSMALMGYSQNPPSFLGRNGQKFTFDDVISQVKEVNDLPFDSVSVEADIQYEDKVKKIVEELEDLTRKLSKDVALQQNYNDFTSDMSGEGKKSTYEDLSSADAFQEPIPIVIDNPFTDFYSESYSRHYTSTNPTVGTVENAAKPIFYFKATAHQLVYKEILNDEGQIEISGGGGSINGYKFDSITNQFEAETIDLSQRSEDMIIRADASTALPRVLRFEPNMPEGFYVESFSISGFPAGVTIFDKDGNAIAGTTLTKEQMIFKDELGNIIAYNAANFLTTVKSVEFNIEYDAALASPFNIAITANYQLDDAYLETTDLDPSQSYTNEYTLALKDITSASDYTYQSTDFLDGKEEGFIFSKETNINIIKDGSGDSVIYGGIVTDKVYDGAGDDIVYLSAGDDTHYGGSGTNYIYGDTDTGDIGAVDYAGEDTVSYENVQSFESTEMQLLYNSGLLSLEENQKLNATYEELDANDNVITNPIDVDMLAFYKGVYVDLDGVYIEGLDIDVNGDKVVDSNDKINVLSKFADRVGTFTYNDDGDAISTTLTTAGLGNLQSIGYDILEDIENVTGSSYNDTIYGNVLVDNTLSGLAGSDTLDGRGGDNTLLGGDGYDTLMAGTGNDYIDGGADTDVVSYENATEGVIIHFDRPNEEEYDYVGTDDGSGFVLKDTLINVEDIRASAYDDIIYGNGSTNFIEAGDGDDKIFAGGGYDFIDGGAGSDWITYNPDDYSGGNTSFMEEIIQGIKVDLNSTDFVMVRENGSNRLIDLVKSIEQVRGTDGNDIIYGNNSNAAGFEETFWGLGGDDRLEGRGGADKLYGGDGNDYINPGAGFDQSWGGAGVDFLQLYNDGLAAGSRILRLTEAGTVEYSTDSTNGVNGTWTEGYDANGGINYAYEFEGIGGSGSDDAIYGNTLANVLNGSNGDDLLSGMAGDDTLNGGNDSDIMYGGDGDDFFYGSIRYNNSTDADEYHGGNDYDTLDYSKTNHNYAMNVTMTGSGNGAITFSGTASNVTNYGDSFTSIEKLITSRGNDIIHAESDLNGIYLDGANGKDYIYGGAGNDTIIARNTSGEILDGNGGVDTLKLAQSVNFTANNANASDTISILDFEVLDLGDTNYYARFNIDQWYTDNSFNKIIGGDSTRIFLHGTNSGETFDFGGIDFSEFSGSMYVYGYNGDDTFDFTNSTLNSNMTFYLDAGGNTDTLELGADQTLSMTDNYYNTFEDFNIGSDSALNVNALNNNGRSFYAHNKDFDDVDSLNDGQINFTGGSGNDIFYVDYTALRDGKLTVNGANGTDIVDIRSFIEDVDFTDSSYNDMFSNIETLDIDQGGANAIDLSADVLVTWIDGADLTLNIANAQGSNITISDIEPSTSITNLTYGNYDIVADSDPNLNFTMAVV